VNIGEAGRNPICRADQLGQPIPNSEHAISVALPRWQDVVDYEEKAERLNGRIRTGYPRFVVHPLVLGVAKRIAGSQPCLPFPSEAAARLATAFVQKISGQPAQAIAAEQLWAVTTNSQGEAALRAFWQHTGLIVSSRQAAAWLDGRHTDMGSEVLRLLRQQLAGLYDCEPGDIFLTPSGMAAQTLALLALRDRAPDQPTAQLGFPYVDTLKLQQKLGNGGILLHHLDTIEAELTELARQTPLAGCFCEIPGNPCSALRTPGASHRCCAPNTFRW
jgi:cystathionine gamma-synthase